MKVSRTISVFLVALGLGACGGAAPAPADEPVMFEDEAAANAAPQASEEVERGEGLLATGDAAAAEEVLRAAIEASPDDVRAHLDLGLALEMLERFDEAEAAYRAAIAIDEEFAEALNNLGVLLRDTERGEEAIEILERAIAVRPGFASAQLNLALALEEVGRIEDAVAAYERVIELAPREPTARIQLGLIQVASGDTEQGLLTLRRAASAARGNAAMLSALGNGLRRAGDPAMAVRVLREAIEADEDVPPPVHAELALALFAAGQRPEAEAALERVIAAHSDYAIAHYLLANMLAAREAFADAATHYQSYLRIDPDGPQADGARARLRHVRQR